MTDPNTPATSNQIKCPHCGQTYAVRPEQWGQYAGRTINCTRCAQPFVVSAPAGAAGQPPQPMQPPAAPQAAPTAFGGAMGQPAPGGYPGAPGQAPPPGYGGAYPGYAAPGAGVGGNGWAITSLVTGIVTLVLFCVPFLAQATGIFAIIGGIVGLRRTADGRAGGRGMAIAGLITGGIGLLISLLFVVPFMMGATGAFLPAFANAREAANRVKCAANMRQLGQAMMMYANNNNGAFPDKLEEVLTVDPTLDRNVFVCPDDDKAPPSAANAQTAAHQIAAGTNCSYLYVGNGLTTSATPDTVLLYEPPALHKKHNPGMNVLFADGHVEFLDSTQSQTILNQQAAGTRPIKVTAGP